MTKWGFLDAADMFPKEANFLGSPLLPCSPCTSNSLQILDGKVVFLDADVKSFTDHLYHLAIFQ